MAHFSPMEEMQFRAQLMAMSEVELAFQYSHLKWWGLDARPEQLAPLHHDWYLWLALAGRGWGKTRTGAQWVFDCAWQDPGSISNVVTRRDDDHRTTTFAGPSGLLSVIPKQLIAETTKKPWTIRLVNDSLIQGFSAYEPDTLRGPQSQRTWCDEIAAWDYIDEAFDNVLFSTRLKSKVFGDSKIMATTTPRPRKLIKSLLEDARAHRNGHFVTGGPTSQNAANLSQRALERLYKRYKGTRQGRQELEAELIMEVAGALWTLDMLDALRVKQAPRLRRIVVAVDPSGSQGVKPRLAKDYKPDRSLEEEKGEGNDIGIVVAGLGENEELYVLEDATINAGPAEWGARAVRAYMRWGADCIVGEMNFGGAMVQAVVQTAWKELGMEGYAPFRPVNASRGKTARAEPIAMLYEQGRAHHVGTGSMATTASGLVYEAPDRGGFADLEDQMTQMTGSGYIGAGSPDRVDALVWAATELTTGNSVAVPVVPDMSGQSRWAEVNGAAAADAY